MRFSAAVQNASGGEYATDMLKKQEFRCERIFRLHPIATEKAESRWVKSELETVFALFLPKAARNKRRQSSIIANCFLK